MDAKQFEMFMAGLQELCGAAKRNSVEQIGSTSANIPFP
jgi:hypothetical protein